MTPHRLDRDLMTRVATAAVLGAVFLGVVLFGGVPGLGVLVAAIAAAAAHEFYEIVRQEHRTPNEVFGLVAAAAMPLAAAFGGLEGLGTAVAALVVASLLWHLAFRQVRTADTAATVFGAVYVGFSLAHLVLVRRFLSGTELVLAVLFGVWANDVFAYLVGKRFGRHKMAPRTSPNKSWEGFLAGTFFTILVWTLTGLVADTGVRLPGLVLVGVAVSIAAIAGDLAESRIKREADIKDSGRGLPGHGGFLDRFDSLILVSVVAYYGLLWLGAVPGLSG